MLKAGPQLLILGGASLQLLDSAPSRAKRSVLFYFGAWRTRGF